LVELLVDRVVVTGDNVEIRYAIPTSRDGPHLPFCHLRTDYHDALLSRHRFHRPGPDRAVAGAPRVGARAGRFRRGR
ncbi:MAG: hypothetical protein M3Q29_15290, partial [Chloroflexota bacterium]|nr:hypothetical protein [Chloroflexota bacterium]